MAYQTKPGEDPFTIDLKKYLKDKGCGFDDPCRKPLFDSLEIRLDTHPKEKNERVLILVEKPLAYPFNYTISPGYYFAFFDLKIRKDSSPRVSLEVTCLGQGECPYPPWERNPGPGYFGSSGPKRALLQVKGIRDRKELKKGLFLVLSAYAFALASEPELLKEAAA